MIPQERSCFIFILYLLIILAPSALPEEDREQPPAELPFKNFMLWHLDHDTCLPDDIAEDQSPHDNEDAPMGEWPEDASPSSDDSL